MKKSTAKKPEQSAKKSKVGELTLPAYIRFDNLRLSFTHKEYRTPEYSDQGPSVKVVNELRGNASYHSAVSNLQCSSFEVLLSPSEAEEIVKICDRAAARVNDVMFKTLNNNSN